MSVIQHIRKSISNPKNLNQALFLCNISLGDQIDMIGAVRYLSQFHDQIHLPCFESNIKTLSEFYSDTKKVVLIKIDYDWYRKNWLIINNIKGEKQYLSLIHI